MRAQFWIPLLALLLLNGCGPNDLPEYSALGDLRILSMTVDDGSGKSEVLPGATVSVTSLLTDLNGAGRALTYAYEACVDPGVGAGADPSCALAADRVVGPSGSVALSGTFTAPNYTGAGPAWTGIAIPTTLLSSRSTVEQFNGVPYMIRLVITVTATGAQIVSIKRVLVSSVLKTSKNSNPTLSAIQATGLNVTALPTATTAFTPVFSSGSAETYTGYTTQGTAVQLTEALTVTWFYTDGKFKRTRTEGVATNDYTPPTTIPTAHGVVLIGVVRDGRGGESYQRLVL